MSNKIIESWKKNASEWIEVIDSSKITSRKYTNRAIVETLKKTESKKILDIGCGEGWLTRNITKMGKQAVGLDAIGVLLDDARKKGPESYYQISYEDIMAGIVIPEAPYDVAVFNFCLYQNEGIETLFNKIKNALCANGSIIVQTLHPFFLSKNGLKYESQTVKDSWKGLPGNFVEGHSWFARTFEDWVSVFNNCNLKLISIREILDDKGQPISIIISVIK